MKKIFSILAIFLLVIFLTVGIAEAKSYLVFGRNPVISGGMNDTHLGADEKFMPTDQDYFITMSGGSGEVVSGWMKAGTVCKWRKVQYGDKLYWKLIAVQVCGNPVHDQILIAFGESKPEIETKSIIIHNYVTVNNNISGGESAPMSWIPIHHPTTGGYVSSMTYQAGHMNVQQTMKPGDINIKATNINTNNTSSHGGNSTNINNNNNHNENHNNNNNNNNNNSNSNSSSESNNTNQQNTTVNSSNSNN